MKTNKTIKITTNMLTLIDCLGYVSNIQINQEKYQQFIYLNFIFYLEYNLENKLSS